MAKEKDHKSGHEMFAIRRSFHAPREQVFAAFTDPQHLMRWWGPKAYSMVYCKLDLRPRGQLHYCASSPEGIAAWGSFSYSKIEVGHRLAFVNSFSEEASFPGWPKEALHQLAFMEQDGKTIVLLTTEIIDPKQKNFIVGFKAMHQDFNEAFDKLEDHLAATTGDMSINKIA